MFIIITKKEEILKSFLYFCKNILIFHETIIKCYSGKN